MNTPATNTSIPNPNLLTEEIEEIGFSLVGNNLNPMMLSYEFLTSSGIVPRNWELAKQPATNQRMSQIAFQNGVSIVAQPGVVNFVEGVNGKKLKELLSPNVVLEYITKLPHAEYQRLNITPKMIVPFGEGDPDAARKFITEVLLNEGSWKEFGQAPVQASLNLSYQLEQTIFNLGINEAKIQLPNKVSLAGLLFAGNFTYNLPEDNDDDLKLDKLKTYLNLWQENMTTFRQVVKQKFLQTASNSQESLFSSL
ncbi:MAG: hypothetical protein EA365_09080 [Gloeocapsa sp. DLM2.Bin57]|nr:MAG: hypothetical protein EA365_09080 [Gloeocapsa sp. DLM2.Bin57]